MKKLFVLLAMAIFLMIGGCGGGGGDGAPADSCAGPIPCLTGDWGNTFYVFEDQSSGDPVVLLSDGTYAGVGGYYYDGGAVYAVALTGPVSDCRNAQLDYGAIDWDGDGLVQEDEIFSMQGSLNVCATTLRVYNLSMLGELYPDVVAIYHSTQFLSITDQTVQVDRGIPTKIIQEMLKRVQ